MKIAVLGMGSWGTALAQVLNDNQHQVTMWSRNQEQVDHWHTTYTNPHYLPGIAFDQAMEATTDLSEAIDDASLILIVIPTSGIREISQKIKPLLKDCSKKPVIVHASKGLELNTHLRISQIIEQTLTKDECQAVAVISGPSHAEEVAVRQITTVTVACENEDIARTVQNIFMTPYFRVYTNADLVGVELGGALKNIIAIAAGLLTGLELGDNSKAALMTRGLAEMTRLGVALGAQPMTFSGLSGMGDLIVTATSEHSRNFRAGKLFAKGMNIDQVRDKVGMAIEGIFTCQSAVELADQLGVEMPISQALHQIMFKGKPIRQGIATLMTRDGKSEAELYD